MSTGVLAASQVIELLCSSGQSQLVTFSVVCRSHPDLVLAHSMGGKVALEYVKVRAALAPDAETRVKPQNVWILDSQPGTVGPDLMPDVTRVLHAVQVRRHNFKLR